MTHLEATLLKPDIQEKIAEAKARVQATLAANPYLVRSIPLAKS